MHKNMLKINEKSPKSKPPEFLSGRLSNHASSSHYCVTLHALQMFSMIIMMIFVCFACVTKVHNDDDNDDLCLLFLQGESIKYYLDNLERIGQMVGEFYVSEIICGFSE